jgi:hypothetical protein
VSYNSSLAQSSQGTIIQIDDNPGGPGGVGGSGSPATWLTINEVKKITFSNKNMFADVTNTQSTAKEFLPVLQDPGKCECEVNRVSTDPGQGLLQNAFTGTVVAGVPVPTKCLFRVVFPINIAAGQTTQGDIWQFLAYVEQLSPDLGVDKPVTSKFTLQITNGITVIEGN